MQKLRLFPPEQNPEQFQAISEAYAAIKDELGRAKVRLFGVAEYGQSLADLVPASPSQRQRIGVDLWRKALKGYRHA